MDLVFVERERGENSACHFNLCEEEVMETDRNLPVSLVMCPCAPDVSILQRIWSLKLHIFKNNRTHNCKPSTAWCLSKSGYYISYYLLRGLLQKPYEETMLSYPVWLLAEAFFKDRSSIFSFFTWCADYPQNETLHAHMHVRLLQSCQTLVTLWTVPHEAPLSMGFSRQEYWSGLLCPPPGDLPDWGIKPVSPVLQESLPAESLGKPKGDITGNLLYHPHHHHKLHHLYPHNRWPKPHLSF